MLFRSVSQSRYLREIKLRVFKDNTFTPTVANVQNRLQTILERIIVDINFYNGNKYRTVNLWELTQSKEDGNNGRPPITMEGVNEVPFAIATGATSQVPEIKQWEITLVLDVDNAPSAITSISWRRNVTIEPIKLSVFDDIREALLTKPFMQEYSFKWNDTNYFNRLIGRLGKLQNYTSPLEGLMVKTYQSDLLS